LINFPKGKGQHSPTKAIFLPQPDKPMVIRDLKYLTHHLTNTLVVRADLYPALQPYLTGVGLSNPFK
jgi:hypothetical protein